MPNVQRKYRWDRITLVGGTFLLLVFSLVAWMAPDTAAAEEGLSLEHPGEDANRDRSLPASSDPLSREHPPESTVRSEASSHATSNGASAEVEEGEKGRRQDERRLGGKIHEQDEKVLKIVIVVDHPVMLSGYAGGGGGQDTIIVC